MIYKFNVEEADKATAIAAATVEIDAAIESGDAPALVRDAALASIAAHVAMLPDPGPTEVVGIGVDGSASDYGAGFVAIQTSVSVIVKPA